MNAHAARSIDVGIASLLASTPVDVDDIRSALGLTIEEVAQTVGKSSRTVSRWRKDAADHASARGDAARRARELARLRCLAEDVLGRDQMAEWLRSPNKGFRGAAPVDLMTTGKMDVVLAALERLADGAPA